MRITLDIADDVLAVVKDLARRENRTAGEVISDLARKALAGASSQSRVREPRSACGFQPFQAGAHAVTNEIVDDLRDREGS